MKVGFIFSGQGSQYVGMGKDLYENFECCKEIFEEANKVLGFDIKDIIFNGPSDELNITSNTQPAILTTSIAIMKCLEEQGIKPDVVAGLSLGEYSALVASESIDFNEAVMLVRKRGTFMQEAVPAGKGAMAAVLGLNRERISDCLSKLSNNGLVEIANINTNKQIVIGGETEAMNTACQCLEEEGARRIIPLKVSGPFHTSLLEDASIKLCEELKNTNIKEPKIKIISNVTADYVSSVIEIKELLKKQVMSSVRWSEIIERMIDDGVDTFIELGPNKVLSSFVKEISREKKQKVKILNVEDIKSLNKTLEEIRVC